MRQRITAVLMILGMIILCVCSTEPQIYTQRNPVNIADATGSTLFKNSEDTVKTSRYENDYIRIWPTGELLFQDEDDEDFYEDSYSEWMQEKNNGTEKTELDAYVEEIWWLTNSWMYYSYWEDGFYFICRSPVDRKEERVDAYVDDKEEVLLKLPIQDSFESYLSNLLVTDSYVLMEMSAKEVSADEGDEEYSHYRYDLETKEVTTVWDKESVSVLFSNTTLLPFTIGNVFFVESKDNNLYYVDADTLEKKKIYSGGFLNLNDVGITAVTVDNTLYFAPSDSTTDNVIMKYEAGEDEAVCVLDKTAFQDALDELELADHDGYDVQVCIEELNTYQNKLYMILKAAWCSKERIVDAVDIFEEGEIEEIHRDRDVVVSVDLEVPDRFTIEEKLSDFIFDNSKRNTEFSFSGRYGSYSTDHTDTLDTNTRIYFIYDGKVFFEIVDMNNVSDEYVYCIYDIAAGKVVTIDEDDYRVKWYEEDYRGRW